jgi:hypothetical protein
MQRPDSPEHDKAVPQAEAFQVPKAPTALAELAGQRTQHRTVRERYDHTVSNVSVMHISVMNIAAVMPPATSSACVEELHAHSPHPRDDIADRLEPRRPQRVVLERTGVLRLELGARSALPRPGPSLTKPGVDAIEPSGGQHGSVLGPGQVRRDNQRDRPPGDDHGSRGCLLPPLRAQRVLTSALHDLPGVAFGLGMAHQDEAGTNGETHAASVGTPARAPVPPPVMCSPRSPPRTDTASMSPRTKAALFYVAAAVAVGIPLGFVDGPIGGQLFIGAFVAAFLLNVLPEVLWDRPKVRAFLLARSARKLAWQDGCFETESHVCAYGWQGHHTGDLAAAERLFAHMTLLKDARGVTWADTATGRTLTFAVCQDEAHEEAEAHVALDQDGSRTRVRILVPYTPGFLLQYPRLWRWLGMPPRTADEERVIFRSSRRNLCATYVALCKQVNADQDAERVVGPLIEPPVEKLTASRLGKVAALTLLSALLVCAAIFGVVFLTGS